MQKYQVFIKQNQLSFVEKAEKYEQSADTLFITSPESEEFEIMVKGLLELPQNLNLQFVVTDPTESLKAFKQHFSLIQAAGGRVTNAKGQMLWIKRLGVWDLPKGKIEQGETVELAAVREVEEECGIGKLKITAPLSTTYHMYVLKEEIILKETFWFEMETADEGGLIPQEEEDIEAAVWVEPNDLVNKLSDTYPSISSLFNN